MVQVAVVLSGCGVFDGSEIHESVLALLALDKADVGYQCFAPNVDAHHVINHITQETMDETRNVLVESARIARGQVEDIKQAKADDFDAVVIPGGFGAAKNLCSFAIAGADHTVQADVQTFLQSCKQKELPMAFLCIAPTLIPKCFEPGIELTIGSDEATATAVNKMGGRHVECEVDDYILDEKHKILSTPAYMLAGRIKEAQAGIDATITKLLELC